MNIEEQLKRYRENQNIIPDEQHIKETVRKSIESYCSVEQEKQLTYWEFLWTKSKASWAANQVSFSQ